MAVTILKVYKEHFPQSRLIGRRYTEADRLHGGYGHKWGEWFQKGLFEALEPLNSLSQNECAYLGMMRVVNDEFEYWIGMMFEKDTVAPDGYDFVDADAFDCAVFWLYGNEESGELFGMEPYMQCMNEMEKQGLEHKKDGCWCIERYNCPRYTTPDEKGNVILDYCISIEK